MEACCYFRHCWWAATCQRCQVWVILFVMTKVTFYLLVYFWFEMDWRITSHSTYAITCLFWTCEKKWFLMFSDDRWLFTLTGLSCTYYEWIHSFVAWSSLSDYHELLCGKASVQLTRDVSFLETSCHYYRQLKRNYAGFFFITQAH